MRLLEVLLPMENGAGGDPLGPASRDAAGQPDIGTRVAA
jgi:hypothetical protein